jgi:hypothetical protein
MRGCVAVEIAELRGVGTRDAESIKDFLSADSDKWTPKYVEFAVEVYRRCAFIGTTDNEEFLTDPAGNFRRWLPLRVGVTGAIDGPGAALARDQLWAEGFAMFLAGGVAWRDAETLARAEHAEYVVEDDWASLLEAWAARPALDAEDGPQTVDNLSAGGPVRSWCEAGFTVAQALTGIGLVPHAINSGSSKRAASALRALGFSRERGRVSSGTRNLRVWKRV